MTKFFILYWIIIDLQCCVSFCFIPFNLKVLEEASGKSTDRKPGLSDSYSPIPGGNPDASDKGEVHRYSGPAYPSRGIIPWEG